MDRKKYERALESVTKKEMDIRQAAKACNVPKHSLHRRLKSMKAAASDEIIKSMSKNLLGWFRNVFSDSQEKELIEYIVNMDAAFMA